MKNEIPTLAPEVSHSVATPNRMNPELRENPRENPRETAHENYPSRRERENMSHRERRENRQSYLQQQQQQVSPSILPSQQHAMEDAYHPAEKIYSPRNMERDAKMENTRRKGWNEKDHE